MNFRHSFFSLFFDNRAELTRRDTHTALNTLRLIDCVRGQLLAGRNIVGFNERANGASPCANTATEAFIGNDFVFH